MGTMMRRTTVILVMIEIGLLDRYPIYACADIYKAISIEILSL